MIGRRGWLGLPLLGGCSGTDVAAALTPASGSIEQAGLRYGPLPRQFLDLTLPAGAVRARLVFLYGGGWNSGARSQYRFLARTLASRGIAVAVPDYGLWPDARWPDFLEDAALAVRWMQGSATIPPAPLFLLGHSAGGFIAVALALDPRWLGADRAALAGAVGLAGVYDYQPTDQPIASIFAAAPGGRIQAAPDDADLASAPPLLLLHGEADDTVRPEQSRRLAARMLAAGGRVTLRTYPGVAHIGILVALAAPVRAMGLAGGPVLHDLLAFLGLG